MTTFVGWRVKESARIAFIIIGSFEVVSAVVGNSLLLTVLLTNRSLRGFHYLFIANLAVADLLTLGYWMTFFVLDMILGHHPVADEAHCAFNGFLLYVSTAVSVLSLMSISLNRYLHVCHHRLYSRVFSLPRVIVWCLLLWVVAAVLSLPPFFGISAYGYHRTSHTCATDELADNMYVDTISGCFTIVPMIFVGYWNFAIFRYWRHNKVDADRRYPAMKGQQQQSSSSSQDQKVLCQEDGQNQKADDAAQPDQTGSLESLETQAKPSLVRELQQQPSDQYNATMQQFHILMKKERAKEQAFVRSLLVVFLLLVLCFLPYGINIIVTVVILGLSVPPEVTISLSLVLLFNCSVNWIVYGVMNRSFRRGYVTLLRRVLGTCFRRPCPRPPWSGSPPHVEHVNTSGRSDGSGSTDFLNHLQTSAV